LIRIQVVAILAFACALLIVYAYPGYMSFDSVVQLREARAGIFTDWHPPAMAALWRVVECVHEGPLGMLVLQILAFLIGSYLVLRRFVSSRIAAACAAGLLVFPPIATTLAVIWKDSQMIGYLMLGTGLLLGGRRSRLAGIAVLTAASAMRHNGFTFTFAIVVLLWEWSATSFARRYGFAVLVWIGMTACGFLVNLALTDTHAYPWHGSIAIADIVGTLRFSGESNAAMLEELQGVPLEQSTDLPEKIHDAYSPRDGVFRIVDRHLIRQPVNEAERSAIASAWRAVVLEHPRAYLHHRWRVFGEALGIAGGTNQWVWIGVEPIGRDMVPYEPTTPQLFLQRLALEAGTSFLMRPWIYFAVIALELVFVIRRRSRVLLALSLSAVISELALFFICPTPDFRYSVWLVPVALVVIVGLFGIRSPKRKKRTPVRRPLVRSSRAGYIVSPATVYVALQGSRTVAKIGAADSRWAIFENTMSIRRVPRDPYRLEPARAYQTVTL